MFLSKPLLPSDRNPMRYFCQCKTNNVNLNVEIATQSQISVCTFVVDYDEDDDALKLCDLASNKKYSLYLLKWW